MLVFGSTTFLHLVVVGGSISLYLLALFVFRCTYWLYFVVFAGIAGIACVASVSLYSLVVYAGIACISLHLMVRYC